MGCVSSIGLKRGEVVPRAASLKSKIVVIPISVEYKTVLRESWKLLEQEKLPAGKKVFIRLLELSPNLQNTFPAFKGVTIDELMTSRSLYLHSKRLMAAVENAVSSLDDAQVFIEYLMNLGERHLAIAITKEHLKVMEEAFIFMLKDILNQHFTELVGMSWRELFGFIARTMLEGLRRAKDDR